MAPNTKNVDIWTLEEFSDYLAHSSRLGGVADGFKEIFGMMNSLREHDRNPISYDMTYERAKKLNEIKAAAAKYIEKNPKGFTSTSKERCMIMEALGKLCDQEKELTSLDANVRYFKGKTVQDVRKGVTGEDFERMERIIVDLESSQMTEETVIQYTNAVSSYVHAAESYLHVHKENKDIGQKWDQTKFNLAKMRGGDTNLHAKSQGILQDYKPFLDQARDMKKVRGLIAERKSWDDLQKLRTAHHVMNEKGESVGALASLRMQTTVNGTKGFFTKETFARMDMAAALHKYIDENPTRTGSLFFENKECLSQVPIDKRITMLSEKSDFVFLELCGNWNDMPMSRDREEMKSFLKDLRSNGMKFLKDVAEDYEKRASQAGPYDLTHPAWIKENYSASVERYVTDPKMREQFLAHSDMITKGIAHNFNVNKRSESSRRMNNLELHVYDFMLKQDETTVAGLNSVYAGQRFLKNQDAKKEFMDLQRTTSGVYKDGLVGQFDEKDRVNMTSRNVLTSRIAEMLQVGHLIAHAEHMTMEIDGVTSSGCFMEHAKGIDAGGTTKYSELAELAKVNPNRLGPGFARDAASLNLLDVICAQYDRHALNFFTILGPENEHGEREIIGLQGIDNDQAFSRKTIEGKFGLAENGKGAGIEQIKLVDHQFAERILSVTPEMIEYAAGDILSEHEIEAFMTRINQVKEYIRSDKMIRLNGDAEWDLDRYSNPQNDKEKRIGEIAKSMQVDVNKKLYPWNITHSNVAYTQYSWKTAKESLEAARKQHEREEKDLQDYKEIMAQNKPEDMTPQKKTAEEVRAKRAAIFDKLVEKKTEEQKAPAQQSTRTSFAEMSGTEKPLRKSGITIGSAAKAAQKKEKDPMKK